MAVIGDPVKNKEDFFRRHFMATSQASDPVGLTETPTIFESIFMSNQPSMFVDTENQKVHTTSKITAWSVNQ